MHEVGELPTAGLVDPTASPYIVPGGDPLPFLASVHASTRGVVVGIALSGAGRTLRHRLRALTRTIVYHAEGWQVVRHVLVVVQGARPATVREQRSLSSFARHAHVQLQMRLALDVCVTVITIDGQPRPEEISRRIEERMRTTPLEGWFVTEWGSIASRPISDLVAEALL